MRRITGRSRFKLYWTMALCVECKEKGCSNLSHEIWRSFELNYCYREKGPVRHPFDGKTLTSFIVQSICKYKQNLPNIHF
jgi:hypothetical protein